MQVFMGALWWLWEGYARWTLGRGDCPQVFTSALWWVWEDLCRGRYTGPGRSAPCCLQILTVEQDLCLT